MQTALGQMAGDHATCVICTSPAPEASPVGRPGAAQVSMAELFSRWHKGAAGCSLPFVFLPVHFSGGWHFRHSTPQGGGVTNLTNLGFVRLLGVLRLVTPLGYSLHIKDFWIAGLPHTATRSLFCTGSDSPCTSFGSSPMCLTAKLMFLLRFWTSLGRHPVFSKGFL